MSSVQLRVARPGPALTEALKGVEGVTAVQPQEDGRYRISAVDDVRETLAAAAVPFGLLELGGQRGLEDVFLQLTGEAA